MKNSKFELVFDQATGGIKSLYILADPDRMDWVKDGERLNIPVDYRRAMWDRQDFALKSFVESDSKATAIYSNGIDCEWRVEYGFLQNGNIKVENTLINLLDVEEFFLPGQLGLKMTFFDDYKDAATCIKFRCHEHLWPKGESAFIYLQKMGLGKDNLGVCFTQGALDGYEQDDSWSNERGKFTLYPDPYIVAPSGTWTLTYEIFTHEGKNDFARIMKSREDNVFVEVENETCFLGETMVLRAYGPVKAVLANGAPVEDKFITYAENCCEVRLLCDKVGELKFDFVYGEEKRAVALCTVRESFWDIADARVRYMVENQLYLDEGSKLDGAFLIKDAETGRFYFDNITSDHNASRERFHMGTLLARYLRVRKDACCYEEYKTALIRHLEFCKRELLDENTGEVFQMVNREYDWTRLYNAPWLARMFTESYYVTGDKELLVLAGRIMDFYYKEDGAKFYPIAIPATEMIEAMLHAGLTQEADSFKQKFLGHVDKIVEKGLNYPPHEVNYEQTIVGPAAVYVLDACAITGDKKYLQDASQHLQALDNFDGIQPSYKLDRIAIRYWDGFWFGKYLQHGDTLHYWSAVSSEAYIKYYALTGDNDAAKVAAKGFRNLMYLFLPDGTASCAYIQPARSKGNKGEFFDPFMNDQDYALYCAILHLDKWLKLR